MKKNYYEYLFVKADELELPMLIADSLEELSILSGFNFDCLWKAICRNSIIAGQFRVRKVDIRDPEEKFSWEEYKVFCKREGLKESYFKSLQQFRNECFGVV